MPKRPVDRRECGPSLPQEIARALTSALLRHLSSLTALAKSVCDCVRELRANGASREETHAAVRELVTEHRSEAGSDPEEEVLEMETIDAMVGSCLDEHSPW